MSRFTSRRIVQLGIFTALALMIHLIEAPLPRPLPWAKLGLANIVSLVVLHLMGAQEALAVTFLRTLLGALLLGNFLTPAFVLSFSGGMLSTLVMALAYWLLYPRATFIGISVIGALTHNLGQLLLAYLLFFHTLQLSQLSLVLLLPTFILFAVPTGVLVGYLSYNITKRLAEVDGGRMF